MKKHKKIYSEQDCEDAKQLRCWRVTQVPFLYGEGELADDTDHPNARSAAAMLRFTQREDIPLDIGWSIDGGVITRFDERGQPTEDKTKGKTLAQTLGLAGSLTVKPCNPKCLAFIDGDLTKSSLRMTPPKNYVELLQKSRSTTSFIESVDKRDIMLLVKLERLKKSLDDYFHGFTNMQCKSCGNPIRFFKSTSSMPNRCSNCSSSFSMLDIWNAVNK